MTRDFAVLKTSQVVLKHRELRRGIQYYDSKAENSHWLQNIYRKRWIYLLFFSIKKVLFLILWFGWSQNSLMKAKIIPVGHCIRSSALLNVVGPGICVWTSLSSNFVGGNLQFKGWETVCRCYFLSRLKGEWEEGRTRNNWDSLLT